MAIVCKKCQAKILKMQEELEKMGFKYQTPDADSATLPGPWDVATLARLLHQTLSMLAGHAESVPEAERKTVN